MPLTYAQVITHRNLLACHNVRVGAALRAHCQALYTIIHAYVIATVDSLRELCEMTLSMKMTRSVYASWVHWRRNQTKMNETYLCRPGIQQSNWVSRLEYILLKSVQTYTEVKGEPDNEELKKTRIYVLVAIDFSLSLTLSISATRRTECVYIPCAVCEALNECDSGMNNPVSIKLNKFVDLLSQFSFVFKPTQTEINSIFPFTSIGVIVDTDQLRSHRPSTFLLAAEIIAFILSKHPLTRKVAMYFRWVPYLFHSEMVN